MYPSPDYLFSAFLWTLFPANKDFLDGHSESEMPWTGLPHATLVKRKPLPPLERMRPNVFPVKKKKSYSS
jgi:hypothetical protein